MNVPELMYYCAIVLLPPFYLMSVQAKKDILDLTEEDKRNLLKRVLVGYFSDALLFVATDMTSYAKAFCLLFTNTLMSPFIAKFMLGEKIKKWDIIGITIGFIGMLMIIQPFDNKGVTASKGWLVTVIGCILALMAAYMSATALVYIKKLNNNNVHYAVISFY
jgi:drug/metabolite transporter (DMT)-like permease